MNASSLDLRQKMLGACAQRRGSQRAMAARFGVSQSVVEQLLRRRRTSGASAPRPPAGGRRAIGHEAAMAQGRQMFWSVSYLAIISRLVWYIRMFTADFLYGCGRVIVRRNIEVHRTSDF